MWSRFKNWVIDVITPKDIYSKVVAVQNIVASTCKFVPTFGTVASIISAGNAGVITVTEVAIAICTALRSTKAASLYGAGAAPGAAMVGEVVIKGVWLK